MADGIQLPDFPSILSQVDRRVFDNFKRLAEMTAENNNKIKGLEHAIKRLESKIDDIHAGHLGLTPDVYESLKQDQATFKQKETAHKKQLSTASILVGYRPGSPTKQWSQMREADEDKNGSRNIRTPRPQSPILGASTVFTSPRKRDAGSAERSSSTPINPSRPTRELNPPEIYGYKKTSGVSSPLRQASSPKTEIRDSQSPEHSSDSHAKAPTAAAIRGPLMRRPASSWGASPPTEGLKEEAKGVQREVYRLTKSPKYQTSKEARSEDGEDDDQDGKETD